MLDGKAENDRRVADERADCRSSFMIIDEQLRDAAIGLAADACSESQVHRREVEHFRGAPEDAPHAWIFGVGNQVDAPTGRPAARRLGFTCAGVAIIFGDVPPRRRSFLNPAIASRGVRFCGQHSRLALRSASLPLVWIEQRHARLPKRRLDNSRFVSAAKSRLTAGCAFRWVC